MRAWIYILLSTIICLQMAFADYHIGYSILDYNSSDTLFGGSCCDGNCTVSRCRTTLRLCFRDAGHSHADVESDCTEIQNRKNSNTVFVSASFACSIAEYYPQVFQIYVRASHSLNEDTTMADFEPPFTDPLIDDIFIEANVEAVPFNSLIVNTETYTVIGHFGIATLMMAVHIRCAQNYSGDNCELLCDSDGNNCNTVLTPPTPKPTTINPTTELRTAIRTESTTELTTSRNNNMQSNELLAGIIAAGIVVIVIILLLVICIAVCLCRKVRKRAFENSRSDNTDDTYENLELFREQIRTETNKAYAVFKRDEDQDSVEYETITDHMEHSTGVYSDLLVGITLFEDISSGQFGGYSRGLFQRNSEVMTVYTREPKKNEDNHNIALKLMLNHPNVIQYYGVTKINGAYLIVLENLQFFGNLKEFLSDHERSVEKLLTYSLEISMGMQHIIEKGLLHQDIAARNILINTSDEKCKIGELGVPKQNINESSTSINFGPVRWMAPESLLQRQFSLASDVWSFGILMWELVNPKAKPYPELETNLQCAAKVISGYTMTPPSLYPRAVQKMIKTIWKKESAQRPLFLDISATLRRSLN